MLMNSLQNFSRGHRYVVENKPQMMITFATCARCCDICSSRTRGLVECRQVLCVLCDFVSHIAQAVSDLLLWLHKATCRLLHQKPTVMNNATPIPDILKDFNHSVMNICNTRPDIIPTSSRHRNICHGITEPSVITVQLYQQTNLGSCICHNQFNSHSHQYINSSGIHRRYDIEVQNFGSNYQNRRNLTDMNDNYASDDCITQENVQSYKNARTMSDDSDQNLCFTHRSRVSTSAQTIYHQQNFSSQHFSNQSTRVNSSLDQRLMGPDSPAHQVQARSQSTSLNTRRVKDGVQDWEDGHCRGHEARTVDIQLTMDIVRTLRSVGDNLDARMRSDNEMPFQNVLLGASKITAGWMIRKTLKRHSSLCGIIGVSLELIHQFNRL